jgi:hypothetical protein
MLEKGKEVVRNPAPEIPAIVLTTPSNYVVFLP